MRTLAPLHFEDLEPHRFEDLVRQLAYDLREWRSIEAVGRVGSDEGIDIRAIEAVSDPRRDIEKTVEVEDELVEPPLLEDRVWLIQCKREHVLGPSKVRKVVAVTLDAQQEAPYGFILAAACDFSKKSRDAFRDECVKRRVDEFYLWGKAELEDKLFQPKNDHLLFAYFGISLQVRRRSAASLTRARLAMKRRLVKHLGGIDDNGFHEVLIRDPSDLRYPLVGTIQTFLAAPPWRYWRFWGHEPPDHLAFIAAEHYAYVDREKNQWDALDDLDLSWPGAQRLHGLPDRWNGNDAISTYHEKEDRYRIFWSEHVPQENRAILKLLRIVPLDRIVAVDEIGDRFNEPPHLLVDYINGQPFESRTWPILDVFGSTHMADNLTRIQYFSSTIREQT